MIRYSKQYWGLQTLLRWYGSAFPRALPFSILAAVLAGLLEGFWKDTMEEQWRHPYPYQAFAYIVGFMIVFRSNLGYGRYWEGRGHLVTMTSKLTDAVVQAVTFDKLTMPKEPTHEQVTQHERFKDNFIHLCSLLHAVALATLREDFNMENLVEHDSDVAAPAANFMSLNHRNAGLDDIAEHPELSRHRRRRRHARFSSKGDSGDDPESPIAASRSLRDSAGIAGMEPRALPTTKDGRTRTVGPRPHEPTLRSVELAFRASADVCSWLDTFMLRTDAKRSAQIYTHMKLPVVGGLTQAEGTALGAFATLGVDSAVPDFDMQVHGCTLDDGLYTPAPTERVHTVLAWVQQCLLERMEAGGVNVAPPIKSRIHHVLSDTMLGYEQARKLIDTQFPFPWAQAMTIVLMLFSITAPFLISAYTTTVPTAMIVTFCTVHTYFMLNEVARDIEDPFHYDPNELPLPQFQYKLNERLLAVARTNRPVAFTDITALHGPGNRPDMQSTDMERYQSSQAHGSQDFSATASRRVSDLDLKLARKTASSTKSAHAATFQEEGTSPEISPRKDSTPGEGPLSTLCAPFSADDATAVALASKFKEKARRWRAVGSRSSRSRDATPRAGDEAHVHVDGLHAANYTRDDGTHAVDLHADGVEVNAHLGTPFNGDGASGQQHQANDGAGNGAGVGQASMESPNGVQRT